LTVDGWRLTVGGWQKRNCPEIIPGNFFNYQLTINN
jgi:hypothetical protein